MDTFEKRKKAYGSFSGGKIGPEGRGGRSGQGGSFCAELQAVPRKGDIGLRKFRKEHQRRNGFTATRGISAAVLSGDGERKPVPSR